MISVPRSWPFCTPQTFQNTILGSSRGNKFAFAFSNESHSPLCVCVCVCVCVFSHSVVSNIFVTPWTAACQAPPSMGARILAWVAIPSQEGLPDPGIGPRSPALAGGSFTTLPPGKPITFPGRDFVELPSETGGSQERWAEGVQRPTWRMDPRSSPVPSGPRACTVGCPLLPKSPGPPGLP